MNLQQIKERIETEQPRVNEDDYETTGIAGGWVSAADTRRELGDACDSWGNLDDYDQDIIATYIEQLRKTVCGLQAFRNSVDEALNSGNGTYKP